MVTAPKHKPPPLFLSAILHSPAAVGLALIFLVGTVCYVQRVSLHLKQNPGTTEDDVLMGQMLAAASFTD